MFSCYRECVELQQKEIYFSEKITVPTFHLICEFGQDIFFLKFSIQT